MNSCFLYQDVDPDFLAFFDGLGDLKEDELLALLDLDEKPDDPIFDYFYDIVNSHLERP